MTISEQAAAIIAEARAKLDELEREAGADEWPKVGDDIWWIGWYGPIRGTWDGTSIDRDAMKRDLAFRTESAARRADERRIVLAELRKLAREAGKVGTEWWEVRKQWDGWTAWNTCVQSGMPRFPTHASCADAIVQIGPARLDMLLDEGE